MVMENQESAERIFEGLNRAASCCRELAALTNINAWVDLSKQFILMRKKAKVMYEAVPLTEVQIQLLVAEMELAQQIAGQIRMQQHG